MNITQGHWIFAAVFAVVFVLGMVFAYREDIRKRPDFFKGSFKFGADTDGAHRGEDDPSVGAV